MKETLKVERETEGFLLKLYLHNRHPHFSGLHIIYGGVLMEFMGAFPHQAILTIFHNSYHSGGHNRCSQVFLML